MQEQLDQPSAEQVREFVIAGHGDPEKVRRMHAEHPGLLNAAYEWNLNDKETAIQAAAQVGNTEIAEYLLEKGAPLSICTAAMLGRQNIVERLLAEDTNRISATGAHGIPLLTHASLSGNLELVQLIFARGARTGVSSALQIAVSRGHYDMVKWFLENGNPDLALKNFQGKTALTLATERDNKAIVQLLREHGATQ